MALGLGQGDKTVVEKVCVSYLRRPELGGRDRYAVNGVPIGPNAGQINLPDRVLVDKYIDCNVRCVFHEGDFLNDGAH